MIQKTPTVLIIDANPGICVFMAGALQKVGYYVITTVDGMEGLSKVWRQYIHCLILDLFLPIAGVSGFEVCRQLRSRDPQHSLAIILTGTRDTPLDQSWALRQGADRYLPKPFTGEMLVRVVTGVLPDYLRPLAALQQIAGNQFPFPGQQPLPGWLKFVPHRYEDPTLLISNNPFRGAAVIPDIHARRLHAAIDGHKNVEELCSVTNLERHEVYRAIQLLLEQQRIRLYTPEGKLADLDLGSY